MDATYSEMYQFIHKMFDTIHVLAQQYCIVCQENINNLPHDCRQISTYAKCKLLFEQAFNDIDQETKMKALKAFTYHEVLRICRECKYS